MSRVLFIGTDILRSMVVIKMDFLVNMELFSRRTCLIDSLCCRYWFSYFSLKKIVVLSHKLLNSLLWSLPYIVDDIATVALQCYIFSTQISQTWIIFAITWINNPMFSKKWDEITYNRLSRWNLGMDKFFRIILENGCIHLFMLQIKLFHGVIIVAACIVMLLGSGLYRWYWLYRSHVWGT